MKLNADIIEGFSKLVLSKNFDDYKPTPACHKEWWDICTSEHPLVAICAPRGHAKTTAITHTFTLASVLFKDRKFVIIISDTYEQSVLFLQDIAKELETNEELIKLFGIADFVKKAENDIIVRMVDGHRFRIVAKGAEQKMRGMKWDNMRPDLIVCDDLENDEIVLNEERREKFKDWFMKAVLPSRSDRGIIRIIGTILHMDSLLENLMPKDWDRKLIERGFVIKDELKSYYNFEKRRMSWYSFRYRAHNEDYSQLLWPEKRTKEWLDAERQRYIDIGNPSGYAQEYLNYPIDESSSYFRREDFLPMTEADFAKRKRHYIAVDLAITETSKADYTVFVVGAVDEEEKLYVVDCIRARMDAREIVDTMFILNKRYDPEFFTIEASLIEKSLGAFIRQEMAIRREYFSMEIENPTKDKQQRARSIQGRMRAGGVKFDKQADWYSDMEQEMRQFPRSRHDDIVDALAWLGLTLDKFVSAPSNKEIEDEAYETLFIESGMYEQGRSEVTGY